MTHEPADPAAATVSPTERARTPARIGLRVGRRPPEPVQMHPEITGRIEEELQAVNPSLQAAIAAVVQVEPEEPTDPGEPPSVPPKQRPYANLDYEERVCCLLEDLIEHSRRIDMRLAAEEHRRHMAEAGALDLQPQPKGLRATMQRCIEAWLLDPQVKHLIVKVALVCATAGGSMVGGGATTALVFEFLERLLRASVTLP